jgi:hypothetical protein
VSGGLFVGFSNHRRLFFLVLILSLFFVFIVIIVGIPRGQRAVHNGARLRLANQPETFSGMRGVGSCR